ncbi:HemK2/MTQ2 family protein methyltransferase [Methanolobus sp. WCC5]|uniref:HemK2/MTQ2 family protein methyltransferase n=1 Tax=Methanolobus sp. WCC5 TaxID=3125785 RepID=UPI003253B52B
MATINYQNATVSLSEQVYEPAEDSFLLADSALGIIMDDMNVLEIGTGSGFVSAVLQANRKITLLATDISPFAASCARSNGIEVIRTDMFKGIKNKRQFDIVIFNPPYLPTTEEEKVPGWLNYAFDGGIDGRREIDPFMEEVAGYLKPEGFILLLVSSLTGIDEVRTKIEKRGFITQVIASKKCSFERLVVIKGICPDNN